MSCIWCIVWMVARQGRTWGHQPTSSASQLSWPALPHSRPPPRPHLHSRCLSKDKAAPVMMGPWHPMPAGPSAAMPISGLSKSPSTPFSSNRAVFLVRMRELCLADQRGLNQPDISAPACRCLSRYAQRNREACSHKYRAWRIGSPQEKPLGLMSFCG